MISFVTYFVFAKAIWTPTVLCLVSDFPLIMSPIPGFESFHVGSLFLSTPLSGNYFNFIQTFYAHYAATFVTCCHESSPH